VIPKKKTFTFGTCKYTRTMPKTIDPDTKMLNIEIPFEEALKLNVAMQACVLRLNSYVRSTTAGKRATLNLTIFLGAQRVAVNEGVAQKKEKS